MAKCYCKFGKKSQINIVELVFALVALFIAFGVLFPSFGYKNRWKEANMILISRDLILTMDRIGELYNYSFDKKKLENFLNTIITEKNLIPWSEVEGTSPNVFVIACNCTEEEINKMNYWFNPLTLNGRRIYLLFQKSNFEEIPTEADVLLIKGYKNLTGFSQKFKSYIARGIGIVEIMDFNTPEKVNQDDTQTNIFGLWCTGIETGPADYMIFSKPTSVKNLTYFPFKYFYHVPIILNASSSEAITGCGYQPSGKGVFNLGGKNYNFWICDDNSVWFDIDADGTRDTLVNLRQNFKINGFNFTLNYINDNATISISFKPEYIFPDYLSYEENGNKYLPKILPIERSLVRAIKGSEEFPAVILNSPKVAWMYDIGDNPTDEEKTLLLSLLLWASRKKSSILTSTIKTGFSTSYVNVQNIDMFEVYKFSLGLAHPY
ncbi:MAG: hypothetical protein QXR09_02900 [Candidatus Aenigmatarchaeota archaeon]